MRAIRRICVLILGLVFALSSVFKLMDPVGTGLIVEGYCQFLHLDFLKPAALVIGELLSLVEAAVCVALVTGVWPRIAAIATMSLLGFFTLISIFLVIFNPDMSCGCFGKVLELTHLQTLLKNLIMLALCGVAFFPFGQETSGRANRYLAFGISMGAIVAFAIYSLVRLPILDHTEYAPCNTIVTEENVVSMDLGYPTLPIWDAEGNYCSEILTEDKVVAIAVSRPEKLNAKLKGVIANIVQDAYNAGWTPVVLSAGELEIPGADVYMADFRKLLSLNRSNAGLVLLDDGYIIKKYARADYPSFEELEAMFLKESTEVYVDCSTNHSIAFQAFFLALLAVMMFV